MELARFRGFLQRTNLDDHVQEWHKAITEKLPIGGIPCDAWYANRAHVIERFLEVGRAVSREIRKEFRFGWSKNDPDLEKAGALPKEWEDGPDGALAGLAILAAGWVAGQTAAKTRDNPGDDAREVFENYIRPLILASMDLEIETEEGKAKR